MKIQDLKKALGTSAHLKYAPKGTVYALAQAVEMISDNGHLSEGVWYISKEGENFIRSFSGFDKFELVNKNAPFDKPIENQKRIMESKRYPLPVTYLGSVKIKQLNGSWSDGVLFACGVGKVYCCSETYLGDYTIGFANKPAVKKAPSDHFEELKKYPDLKLWDGDLSRIPQKNTLLSYHTASNGWLNGIVSGYRITWYKNAPQIRVDLRGFDNDATNERFIEELGLPLSEREKILISKNVELESKLAQLKHD